jgi:nucleoside-diphosphate-sugar epimerase
MRILLTGATGFLGQHLTPRLVAAGHVVAAAVRTSEVTLPAGVETRVVGALDGTTDWSAALAGVDTVIHLAGRAHQVRDTASDPRAAFTAVNRDATAGLAREAVTAGVRHILHLSTIHVLGHESPPGRPFTDDSPPQPASDYAFSKLAGEAALASGFAAEGGSLVILRPPLLVGPGMKGNLERLARLVRAPLPVPLGAIRNRRTLLPVDSLCDAILAVLARWAHGPASGLHAIGDAVPVSTAEIVSALREGGNGRAAILPVPAGLLRAGLVALGRHGLVARLFGDLEVDSSGFRRDFAWDPTQRTLDALREAAAQCVSAQAINRPR